MDMDHSSMHMHSNGSVVLVDNEWASQTLFYSVEDCTLTFTSVLMLHWPGAEFNDNSAGYVMQLVGIADPNEEITD